MGGADEGRGVRRKRGVSDEYFEAAKRYRPKDHTRVLFVAEAPPNSIDRYFYFEEVKRDDWLWIALMKCLYPARWSTAQQERRNKKEWLSRFQMDGFQVIDSLKTPVSGTQAQRALAIRLNADQLVVEIRSINPTKIVLIKNTVYRALFDLLRNGGFPVVNKGAISFPSSGRQAEFHDAAVMLNLEKLAS